MKREDIDEAVAAMRGAGWSSTIGEMNDLVMSLADERDRLHSLLSAPLPDDLTEIEARADAATPGPWEHGGAVHESVAILEEQHGVFPPLGEAGPVAEVHGEDNAAFIAHARADVPSLLAGIRAQAAEIVELREELNDALRDLLEYRAHDRARKDTM